MDLPAFPCPHFVTLRHSWQTVIMRDLDALPKAHLHLHFTGSMRVSTLAEMAREAGIRLPDNLTDATALQVPANQRGWFRFQRAYDAARKEIGRAHV